MDNFLQQMGNRISSRRKELDLTQEELANAVDLSIQTISTAELGKKALRPENIVKISLALNCSTDFLLTGKDALSFSEVLSKTQSNLTPLQYSCLNQIVESFLLAVSTEL